MKSGLDSGFVSKHLQKELTLGRCMLIHSNRDSSICLITCDSFPPPPAGCGVGRGRTLREAKLLPDESLEIKIYLASLPLNFSLVIALLFGPVDVKLSCEMKAKRLLMRRE